MTTVTWPPILYLYAAIPIAILSVAFTLLFPWVVHQVQKRLYPIEELQIHLQPKNFTMLGDVRTLLSVPFSPFPDTC